ncbi:YceI family protein [Pontibacter qinzhouensis]|uniref:YceI family protein n=1 Tax=Pontibacter qinzhouensis TaxID=2603253 RepID=A0A5C8K9Z0_9BACT|nr:YceI family protein [Pontibacter qinzhouensis]TXK47424.1 YceI family protein [Pontibacter qinzhouensis]
MMSRRRWRTLAGMLLLLLVAACDTTIKTDDAEVGEALAKTELSGPAEALLIDTTKSEVTWIGSKMTGRHNGTICIKSGEIEVQSGRISGGQIVLDLTGLQCTDKSINTESSNKLATHLKSADFFDVENHPTAIFEIVSVAPYDSLSKKEESAQSKATQSELKVNNPTHTITGNLTIKGNTKSVTFPARVTVEDSQLKAKANFNIDRTKWGLVYRSDESLGDKTIYSSVNIGLSVLAKPAAGTTVAAD